MSNLVVIWRMPLCANAIGYFTLKEAATLLKTTPALLKSELNAEGFVETTYPDDNDNYRAEWDE